MKLAQAQQQYKQFLQSKLALSLSESQTETNILFARLTGLSQERQILNPSREISNSQSAFLETIQAERLRRKPIQYILSEAYFAGYPVFVSEAVLIPRPETELLLRLALAEISELASPRVYEIGLGSGCLAVSGLCENSHVFYEGCEISAAAFAVASRNIALYGLSSRSELAVGDFFALTPDLSGFDLLLSNPPYLSQLEYQQAQAELCWEPRQALTTGTADGLDFYRALADYQLLPRKMLLELSQNEAASIQALFKDRGWSTELEHDPNGHHRCLRLER